MGIGSAISGIGSVIGGITSAGAATDAAQIQANAATHAAELQKQAFDYTANQLQPYVGIGTGDQGLINPYLTGANNLYNSVNQQLGPQTALLNNLAAPGQTTNGATAPGAFDYQNWGLGGNQQKALENTPGYQFTLNQGLRGVQNAAAAQGRGVSGNALAGAGQYATGLANSTFNQQLQNAMGSQGQAFGQTLGSQQQQFGQSISNVNQASQLQQQQYGQTATNIYQPLSTLLSGLSLAQNAAAMTGNAANTSAAAQGNFLTSGAAAQAAGVVGSNNALQGGFNGASNSLLLNQLMGGGGSNNLFSTGGLLGSQGPLFGNAADSSIAGFGPPLAY